MSLQVTTAHGNVQKCGIVVAGGGLVATTLDAVAGARSITAVTAAGRRLRAVLVAGDPSSDVAVVRVDGRLPAARFAAPDQTSDSGAWCWPWPSPAGPGRRGRVGRPLMWAGSSVAPTAPTSPAPTGRGWGASMRSPVDAGVVG